MGNVSVPKEKKGIRLLTIIRMSLYGNFHYFISLFIYLFISFVEIL